jgi:hypothetical protein
MTLESLKEYCKTVIQTHPDHKDEITELYTLCLDEIQAGSPERHETELCYSEIQGLIEQ